MKTHLIIKDLEERKTKLGIVDLDYVVFLLETLFSRKYFVTGFDVNRKKIENLRARIDRTSRNINNPNLFYTSIHQLLE